MRALVTGASGFAGRHLVEHLRACGDEVVTLARASSPPHTEAVFCDLRDAESARSALAAAEPEVVYHLAAQAHVGRSWEQPGPTLHDNLALALNVLEAVRCEAPGATVVAVSSGEVYGPPGRLPVDESAPLRPQNPYAVSKAATDLLARFYADGHGLRVVVPRAFNHAGPGQDPMYAIASFTRQVASGARRIVTGNPGTGRDYTDVRDVVRAYRLLAGSGEAGQAYNVCSGRAATAGDLVRRIAELAGVEIEHVVDPSLVRAHEVMEIRGSYERLHEATGWEPQIPLDETLRDTVEWWRVELPTSGDGQPGASGA